MDGAPAVLVRLAAFCAGAVLFGGPLFVLRSRLDGPAAPGRLKPWLIAAAALAAAAAAAALIVQTGQMAGDPRAGLDPATLRDVLAGGGFGPSILVRVAATLLALALLIALPPGRALWRVLAALGALGLGALAWAGHGAADPGAAGLGHTAADIAHLLAAGLWLGALACLSLMLSARAPAIAATAALHGALKGFSGVGSAVVAALVATGLVNTWFMVGPDHLSGLVATAWGRLLLAKLVLALAMLGFAALNRWRLTPRLGIALAGDPTGALRPLRLSVALESAAGVAVLALVAALGVLAPPMA